MNLKDLNLSNESVLIVALDRRCSEGLFKRSYLIVSVSDFFSGNKEKFHRADSETVFDINNQTLFERVESDPAKNKVVFVIYPTRTYSEGMGGNLLSEVAPEDRVVMRSIKKRFSANAAFFKVSLLESKFFDQVTGYFANGDESARFLQQLESSREKENDPNESHALIAFYPSLLKNAGSIFKSCITRPNKQDYFYLATKTFGINLIVRVLFAVKGVRSGSLPLVRAFASTAWYQIQDIVFTMFGQTYMKFLGRMTGLFRIGNAYLGDFLFVYVQLSFLEFFNRLILGPIGENPLVYSWRGVGLILFNNLQGMISGGPLTPAFNKMRRAGVISHSTMMHLYQLGSLAMFFGLFASYGYQLVYTILTSTVLVLAWGSYIVFSVFFKDPTFSTVESPDLVAKLDALAAYGYVHAD